MMTVRRWTIGRKTARAATRVAVLLAAATLATGALMPPAADAPGLVALRALEGGMWQLRELGPRGDEQSMCLRDMEALIQLRHAGAVCSRYVIDNRPLHTTVHYTCPGSGYGRTTVDQVTPRSVRIETQGVASGAPFHVELTGRRTGACTAN